MSNALHMQFSRCIKVNTPPLTGDGRLEGIHKHNNNYLFIHHPPEH